MRTTRTLLLSVAALLGLMLVPSFASADYSQGFETDTSGWNNFGPGTIHREASGYTNGGGYADGIASASGGFHARLRNSQSGAALRRSARAQPARVRSPAGARQRRPIRPSLPADS